MTSAMKRLTNLVFVLCVAVASTMAPVRAQAMSQIETSISDTPSADWSIGSVNEAGFCTGSTAVPDIVTQNGQRYIAGTSTQTCSSDEPYTQQLCSKLQRFTGGPNGSYVDATGYRCNTNTGPSISATVTVSCAAAGPDIYRTAARGTVNPVNAPSQTRYGYSSSKTRCY